MDIDATTQELLTEHARGDSYRTIGQRHGMSHEAVRQVVIREGRRFVDRVELDLYVAWKLTQQGRKTEAQWPAIAVAHSLEWSTAIALVQWLVDELRARDLSGARGQGGQRGAARRAQRHVAGLGPGRRPRPRRVQATHAALAHTPAAVAQASGTAGRRVPGPAYLAVDLRLTLPQGDHIGGT